ncbi:RxLR effector protein [Phytophthora megakarya]|uniref:RxLR effector protein n=1 Tax=Phytophthora megakarya TaxID=4795 RepID=A0A225VKP2_9STRA|nr:RxLR effector protein [Phytophthora megakarya]
MRLSYICVLLVAVAALLSCNALSPQGDDRKRSLRSLKTVNKADAQEEERCSFCYKFDFNIVDDIVNIVKLPEQFQRMRDEPEKLRNIFMQWKTGYLSADEAAAFMKKEGLTEKAVEEFKKAYELFLEHKAIKAPLKAAKKLKRAQELKAKKLEAAKNLEDIKKLNAERLEKLNAEALKEATKKLEAAKLAD